jgi:replicative DNA helicase
MTNIRLPPSDLAAEQSVLGTLLIDPDLFRRIEFLEPHYFADPVHEIIFLHWFELHSAASVSASRILSAGHTDELPIKYSPSEG